MDFFGDFRLVENISGYFQNIAGEFTPDTTHLHAINCKCTLTDRLWCDYFGMGTCISKESRARRKERRRLLKQRGREAQNRSATVPSRRHIFNDSRYFSSNDSGDDVREDIRLLIRETLDVIRTLVNNEQEPPQSLLKLNFLADEENGWMMVVKALIYTIPIEDPLGPAVISLFLDECPLPSKEAVESLLRSIGLSETFVKEKEMEFKWHVNMCIVLGSLAEKMAGTASVSMFNKNIQGYLMAILRVSHSTISQSMKPYVGQLGRVRVFALLALEKFAQTRENQITICKLFAGFDVHPLLNFENYEIEQFTSRWALDNIFTIENRPYSYETTDTSKINAMLNHEDVSEYLKIGPDGLEARCDVSSFESVRCTFEVTEGVWYYEATVRTGGVMQIGLATKRSRFLNHEGYGIGDDASSVAYDGCRCLVWHNARSTSGEHRWFAGDTLGVLLNIPAGEVVFIMNGKRIEPNREFLANRQKSEGVFAAASFMSFQQCRFNFGNEPFKFHPGVEFKCFNDYGQLSSAQRTIIPRKVRLERLEKEYIPDDYCSICFDAPATTQFKPCDHDGFCPDCALQLDLCPLCRAPIRERVEKANNNRSMDVSKDSTSKISRKTSQRKSLRASTIQPQTSVDTTVRSVNSSRELARRHTQV
ncbi:unnamed protein product [Caenorhabditis angaria]|uniref:RING-type domain-containing protein n=1 Tax=Caenorhabditis angaria TaxID=860376 RepID=A0A9P1I5X6_9PELO|nr:unnamed protein product [Caenorhabditis angaria]